MKQLRLPIIALLCGAVVMSYELIGSRVLAPTVGSSLFVWTALIGIILASLSLGYWYGGRIADRWPDAEHLALVIWIAAVGITTTAAFHTLFLTFLSAMDMDQRMSAALAAIVLFAPASIALGMVSPYAVRLSMQDIGSSGSTVGALYAASTVGSIAGTFLTGWVLIGYLGTTSVLYLLALVTLSASFIAHSMYQRIARVVTIAIVIALALAARSMVGAMEARGFIDIDTRYQRAQVLEGISADNRPVRYLRTDPIGAQSAIFLDGPDLVAWYVRAFREVTSEQMPPKRTLTIGGGAQVWPMQFMRDFPTAHMDVVEIDSGLIALAQRYFGYQAHDNLEIIHEDGRSFLNRIHTPYDIVYMDAYSGTSIPVQLTTRESAQRIDAALAPDGLVIANTIGVLQGTDSRLLQAMYNTYRSVFEHVVVVPKDGLGAERTPQNILLISSHHPIQLSDAFAQKLFVMDTDRSLPVLTDDYAPVERFAASLFWH